MGIPRLLFLVVLSVAGFAQTRGQTNVWIPRGPEGGVVGRPIIDPQNSGTLYVAAAGTLFKTTDNASHWSQVGALPVAELLAVDPQNSDTLYGSGPSKSTDGGQTWNAIGALSHSMRDQFSPVTGRAGQSEHPVCRLLRAYIDGRRRSLQERGWGHNMERRQFRPPS
jgi:photosystem II stability/assembly factor-like uncharacterized protein